MGQELWDPVQNPSDLHSSEHKKVFARGIGWRGRWEGGSGWGIHVNPWLIHVNVCQKPLQYCKVISLQLIKINEKKKSENICPHTHTHTKVFARILEAGEVFSGCKGHL